MDGACDGGGGGVEGLGGGALSAPLTSGCCEIPDDEDEEDEGDDEEELLDFGALSCGVGYRSLIGELGGGLEYGLVLGNGAMLEPDP